MVRIVYQQYIYATYGILAVYIWYVLYISSIYMVLMVY